MESMLSEFVASIQQWAPAYVLVLIRVAAMFIMTPFLGSTRIPTRVRVLLAMMIALGMAGAVPAVSMPDDLASITMAIGGEIVFGIAMGMMIAFVFTAAQWAGEIIGQQMGFGIVQAFDPQFSGAGSIVGDLYFMLTLIIFISPFVEGPARCIEAVHASFQFLPPLSVGMSQNLFDLLMALFVASATLAFQLAAPILVTMLVVDLTLGCIGKTMPQLNVMSAGLSIRAIAGMLILIIGIQVSGYVLADAVRKHVDQMHGAWMSPGLMSK